MTRLSKLAFFPVLGFLLTMPQAFAGPPSYSFSIVAQTGSVIGGYTIGTLCPGGTDCQATLNDSRQVVFRAGQFTSGVGWNWIGYATPSAVLATSGQMGYPSNVLNFFLNNAGQVYIGSTYASGVYTVPADGSAPLSLLFNYFPMPGVPPCPHYSAPATYLFGVDNAGEVGLGAGLGWFVSWYDLPRYSEWSPS